MIDRARSLDRASSIQYALMIVLGSACFVAALAPIGNELKIAAVSLFFGITAGLWVSHLITVVYPRHRSGEVGE
ncbi:hypothetical protein [Halococcoides cellulosivorans]|nr:hypothetical protein [Halococcoides cellulosivorans]